MAAKSGLAVELVGGPFDGDYAQLEEPLPELFEVTRSGQFGRITAKYEVETDPEMDESQWAIYRGQIKRKRTRKGGK